GNARGEALLPVRPVPEAELRAVRSQAELGNEVLLSTRVSDLDERLGVGPVAALVLELLALVDDDLAVLADADGPALQRPRRGALEVDAAHLEAGAVAGALELLLALQPVRRAAEVRAGGAQRVDDAAGAHDPEVLVLEAVDDLAVLVAVGEADL